MQGGRAGGETRQARGGEDCARVAAGKERAGKPRRQVAPENRAEILSAGERPQACWWWLALACRAVISLLHLFASLCICVVCAKCLRANKHAGRQASKRIPRIWWRTTATFCALMGNSRWGPSYESSTSTSLPHSKKSSDMPQALASVVAEISLGSCAPAAVSKRQARGWDKASSAQAAGHAQGTRRDAQDTGPTHMPGFPATAGACLHSSFQHRPRKFHHKRGALALQASCARAGMPRLARMFGRSGTDSGGESRPGQRGGGKHARWLRRALASRPARGAAPRRPCPWRSRP